jgi:RNA polymerase sigma factor (sigma-70 family)
MNQLDYIPYLKDENFICAIKSGGPTGEQAIFTLYTLYHKGVRATITEMISLFPGCKTLPEDIVHDAFIVMLHKIQFETTRASSLKGLWIGIARKLLLNQVKKNARIMLVQDTEELYEPLDITPETIYLLTERNQQIEKCLALFGNRCKEILLLWMAQFTMEEIAQKLSLSSPRVARKMKHSCFKKLKVFILKGDILDIEDLT